MAARTILFVLVSFILVLSSCGFKDIDKRLFVVAIGFDQSKTSEHKLLIHLKIAIPHGDPKQGDQKFEILSLESETIAGALRLAKSMVDKELDYGHTKVIVVSENIARTKIKQIADWCSRRRDIQLIGLLAVGKPSALDVIKLKPKTERVPANALFLALTKEGTESPYISTEYLFDFQRRLTESGLDPYLPIIEVSKDKYEISKVALLNKDKVVTTLNPDESRLFNMLLGNKSIKTNLTVRTESNTFEFNIEHTSSKYTINASDKRTIIRFAIKLTGALEEKVSVEEISYRKIQEIVAAGEETLNDQIEALLRKFQTNHIDPLGFGLHYAARHWNNKTENKQWLERYKDAEFQVRSHIRVKYSGVIM